ncbi:cell death activator CIDE-A [Megalops cyprinoides]|uniref:cell death activator CIDE-A n=1 Tax=Megalops cyprinoides TaxID=118141 RepID=UPI0018652414|nr:cell death activator CIDE-A [Megalops cyprinoides]
MEYAKNLVPSSVMRSVSSVGMSLTRKVLPSPQPRPFRVCTHNRCRRRGVTATSLSELLEKTASAFLLTCHFLTLVLEEDGTVVDTEAFFQSLPANTQFMVLEKGQIWTQSKGLPSFRRPKKSGIAKLTFDLYKMNPKDFIGCLTIQASLYEIYTMSYDIKCMKAKQILKSLLRCLMYVARVVGHILLCGSSYVMQYIGEDEY